MSFVAAAVAGSAIVGSVISSNAQKSAAKKAAGAQKDASDAQIALQREQMQYAQGAAQPYREAGTGADAMLDARWRGPNAAAPNDAYGPFGAVQSLAPSGAYDRGAPTPAWTQVAGVATPQVARPASFTPPTPPPPPAAFDWRTIADPGYQRRAGPPPPPPLQPAVAPVPAGTDPGSAYGRYGVGGMRRDWYGPVRMA